MSHPGEPNDIIDVTCDGCGCSTRGRDGDLQFGTLQAAWGNGTAHSGEEYELHLCENCFFAHVSGIKRARWLGLMFEVEGEALLADEAFGRVENSTMEVSEMKRARWLGVMLESDGELILDNKGCGQVGEVRISDDEAGTS